jgi:hypothetical protein
MGWTIGVMRFDCRRGLGIFLFTTASRLALGPTQPSIQWVPGVLYPAKSGPGVKMTTHLYLVPRSKNELSYTFTPTIRLHGAVLSYKKSTGTTLRFAIQEYKFEEINLEKSLFLWSTHNFQLNY